MTKRNRFFLALHFVLLGFSTALALPALAESPAADSAGVLKLHLDMRQTISQGTRLRMRGASVGWEWGEKSDEVTLGYYWTGKRGRSDIRRLESFETPFLNPSPSLETDVRFFNAGYWHTIRDWKRWKLATPLEAGVGRVKFTEPEALSGRTHRTRIYPIQAALYGEWKATRWVGTGLQVGYRHYFSPSNEPSFNSLSGLYFRFRVLVYMQTFFDWRDFVFRKQPLPSPFY